MIDKEVLTYVRTCAYARALKPEDVTLWRECCQTSPPPPSQERRATDGSVIRSTALWSRPRSYFARKAQPESFSWELFGTELFKSEFHRAPTHVHASPDSHAVLLYPMGDPVQYRIAVF